MMNATDLAPYWTDDDHLWRYDTDNPRGTDIARPVGYLGDGWMLSDAVELAIADLESVEPRAGCQCGDGGCASSSAEEPWSE